MKFGLSAAAALLALAGTAAAETRAVTGFDSVEASAGIPVDVSVGPGFSVEVTGRDAARVQTRLEGTTLVVRPVSSWNWRRRDVLVRVSMPAVVGLDASSGARLTARGVAGGPLELEASSGAQVTVSGACGALSAEASSGAQIEAGALVCQTGDVDASSGARVEVNVNGRLDVGASSGGDIYASGSPEIGNVSLSSGGSLRRRD